MSTSPFGSVKQLLPHWIAMFLLMMIVLQLVEYAIGELSFWPSLTLVFAVALVYPTLVNALGVAPEPWT
ncbi:MAG: hypothetical protein ACQETB_08875 [Halobacteriota archaeon]